MDTKSQFDVDIYTGKGQSASIFAIFLLDVLEKYPHIRVVSSDMFASASLLTFKHLYPDHCINVGIAEQNLIGVASGLASEGFKSVAVAQGAFISMRCFEQVRQYMSYMQNNVILVGLNAGFMLQYYGNTHYSVEDISLFRSIPGITILSPADSGEAVKAFEAALQIDTPVYIRLTGGVDIPQVYKNYYPLIIGKSNVVLQGEDITIFATGKMVYNAVKAVDILKEKGISVSVIDVHTIKPLDTNTIDNSKNCHLFVSIEEHSIIGGLGTSVAEYISESTGFPPILRLGVKDKYSSPGDYNYLLTQHRLIPELIAEDIINRYNEIDL